MKTKLSSLAQGDTVNTIHGRVDQILLLLPFAVTLPNPCKSLKTKTFSEINCETNFSSSTQFIRHQSFV